MTESNFYERKVYFKAVYALNNNKSTKHDAICLFLWAKHDMWILNAIK